MRSLPEHPCLRPHLIRGQNPRDPDHVYVVDRLGLAPGPVRLTPAEFGTLAWFDGTHSLRDLRDGLHRQPIDKVTSFEALLGLLSRLDEALMLDAPRFRAIADGPVRPPRCLGTYSADHGVLRQQLASLFTERGGPGLPGDPRPDPSFRAALVPHMDYQRGGATYAWGFKEIAEKTTAGLFVIIGTSHYSGHRFTLTRKDFQTPLGAVTTDQDFIDKLVRHYGDEAFADEWLAHFPEHSIELEVVLLQYLFAGRRDFRIVPLVVGSFQDCVQAGALPAVRPRIDRMIAALRRAEAETKEPIFYLISGDLAHIGPRFGDADPLTGPVLSHSRLQDQEILAKAAACDPDGYFRVIAAEADRRNICGLSPTYTVLSALRPRRGQVLHYHQFVHPRGLESVSFASMGFYQ